MSGLAQKVRSMAARLFGGARARPANPPAAETAENESVRQGLWGESVAARDLERRGCRILETRARPCKADRRLEIDIIAESPDGVVLFVEVKTNKRRSEWDSAMPRVNKAKKLNLRRACLSWLRTRRYRGDFRFCVYEIYGDGSDPACVPEIDFFDNVKLFPPRFRFF